MKRQLLALAAATSLIGCGQSTNPVICTANFVYGLSITVKDSAAGNFTAIGARLVTVNQFGQTDSTISVADSPQSTDASPLNAAGEKPGTYTVTVRKASYKDWVKTGVVVTADQCHVHPVALTALLQH